MSLLKDIYNDKRFFYGVIIPLLFLIFMGPVTYLCFGYEKAYLINMTGTLLVLFVNFILLLFVYKRST